MKRFVHTVGLAVAVLWLWHSGSGFAAEPRIALVIGNSAYAEAPLANPANDARLMAETLRGLGFDVIERIDADLETMQLAIFELQDELFEAGKDAVGLFYYAGHGVQVGGQNYLIPLNTNIKKEREVAIKAVSAGFVLGQLEITDNRMNFVILDACRNNPLTRSFRSASRGLARMDAPRGSLIAYSTGPGEVAADGAGANSPYTLALAWAMQMPGIPAEKMFKLVRDRVMDATNGDQTPWEESSLTGEDFYFSVDVSVTDEATVAASITDTTVMMQQDLLFWESIKDSRNAVDFDAYLQAFPDGAFAGLARNRLNELDEVAEAKIAAAEAEAQRLAAEEAARKAAEEEAARIAAEEAARQTAEEAALKSAEDEAARVAAEEAQRKADEEEAFRVAAAVVPPPEPELPSSVQPAVGIYPQPYEPGDTFKDCAGCPEMVVVPAGSFRMGEATKFSLSAFELLLGAPSGCNIGEIQPAHRVDIPKPFAVGVYEVTFAEWVACVAGSGCGGYRPEDENWGRGDRPVINVSWDDAKSYVAWLGRETGREYRLLSEAEWAYAARAGTETCFYWGNRFDNDRANGSNSVGKTVPVGSYPANGFGLYDMHGNVWEWVEDCWHDSYEGAPSDGSTWTTGGECSRRVLRGGSWTIGPWYLLSVTFRNRSDRDDRYDKFGFRVAMSLKDYGVEVVAATAVEQADRDIDIASLEEEPTEVGPAHAWQTGEDIRSAIVGSGLRIRILSRGTNIEKLYPDGTIVGTHEAPGFGASAGSTRFEGRWWIEGDVVCFEYDIGVRADWCGHLAIDDQFIRRWDKYGNPQQSWLVKSD